MEDEKYFIITLNFTGQMKCDRFLCRTQNLVLGAMPGEKGEMSHTLFVLYGQVYKVVLFPVLFLLVCCFSASFFALLKGEMLLE